MLSVYVCLVFMLFLFFLYYWTQRKMKHQDNMIDIATITEYLKITNQDEDVWNISSRVNQQNQGSTANQASNWPTHDTHISMDSFAMTPEYRIKETRPAPPPYSELDLPSYEQATGVPLPKPDLTVVSESRSRSNPGPSS